MSDLLAAAILGLVQGLTEFLPISSTGHLVLAERALGLDPARFGLTFDVALHMGTLGAVLAYFLRTWLGLLADAARGRLRALALIALGTMPAAVAGVLLESEVESTFRDPARIALALLAGSAVFVVAERLGERRRAMGELGVADAVLIGAAQAIALVPGISRSGITISAGLLRHVRRDDAARFAFLLATPVMFGAGAKRLLDARAVTELPSLDVLALGFALSFTSGFAAVALLLRFLRTNSLLVFVVYRVVLAAAILIAVALGML